MTTEPLALTTVSPTPATPPAGPDLAERERLVKRAKLLAWLGIGWHGIEAAIAIGAGLVAGSIALVGFGADSLVEALAGLILIWRFAGRRAGSDEAEQKAQRLIGFSFLLIAGYVGIAAVHALVAGDHPEVSWAGIGLAAFAVITMPPLAVAKGRLGERLSSAATKSEGRQNLLCAYLSAALLVSLGGNALFGFWWLDPITALLIAGVAIKEGREAWRGESCCTVPAGYGTEDTCCEEATGADACCSDDCCTLTAPPAAEAKMAH